MTKQLIDRNEVIKIIKDSITQMDSYPFASYYIGGREACIRMLTAKISSIPSLPIELQWIDVKDRLPEEGEGINTFDGQSVGQAEYSGGFFRAVNYDSRRYFSITHWSRLPLSPK